MKLYRVEQVEYDYSPTLGVFDDIEKAREYLRSIGAKFGGVRGSHDYWNRGRDDMFQIFELTLNVGAEKNQACEGLVE